LICSDVYRDRCVAIYAVISCSHEILTVLNIHEPLKTRLSSTTVNFYCYRLQLELLLYAQITETEEHTKAFLDPEGGSQKATLVVLLVVINSLRVQKSLRLS